MEPSCRRNAFRWDGTYGEEPAGRLQVVPEIILDLPGGQPAASREIDLARANTAEGEGDMFQSGFPVNVRCAKLPKLPGPFFQRFSHGGGI